MFGSGGVFDEGLVILAPLQQADERNYVRVFRCIKLFRYKIREL